MSSTQSFVMERFFLKLEVGVLVLLSTAINCKKKGLGKCVKFSALISCLQKTMPENKYNFSKKQPILSCTEKMLRISRYLVSKRLPNSRLWNPVISGFNSQRKTSHSSNEWKGSANTVIIGGGAVGASIAYHLTRLGMKDVVLLEKSELTAGSTWHAAGLTALYHAGINMKKIHYYSINLYSQLEEETGQELSFHRPGSIRIATTNERMDEFHYQMQRQGWHPAPQMLINPDEILEHFPLLNIEGILGGLYNPADGHIDPYSLTMALAAGARRYGADIKLGTEVTSLSMKSDGQWCVGTPKGDIVANRVVNASGFWGLEVGHLAGIDLPLVPVQHQYMITQPIAEVKALQKEPPVFRHLEGSFYLRAERGGLLIGPYEHQSKMKICEDWAKHGVPRGFGKELFQPDLDRLTDHLEAAMNLVPVLRTANIQTTVNGPIMYTPDLLPMLGPYYGLPNMWMALGFGYGIIHSGGAGKYLADWIMNGEPPYDLIETDPNRFGSWTSRDYVLTKARETYGMNNNYSYPKEERWAGRPTSRISGAYEKMISRGAEMSFHAGWEQPSWFALDEKDKGYKPSFRRSNWFHAMKQECQLITTKAGIIDLSPFAKIDVKGKDASLFLDKLLANKLPKVGTTNISHMLTPTGKVYAELTVTCFAPDHYFVITGSGAEIHDLRWMADHARQWNFDVSFHNATDEMACLSIAGPLSRKVLSKLTQQKIESKSFPFLHARMMEIASIPVRALRITYTGELGWELYHHQKHTKSLYEALLTAGEDYGIGDFGTYALNAMRLEKGFRMWGAEMNVDSNPLEAGLDFFIRLNKPVDFVGKQALHDILKQGFCRKLAYLKVETVDVDPEGNESVWSCNKVVGYTTSGSYGPSVDHAVAFAYLPPFLNVPGTNVQVELLGNMCNATVLEGPPVEIEASRERKAAKSSHL